jgi:transposase
VDNNKGCSLNDIHLHINKQISKSSICKVLKQNKITRKKANIKIVATDPEKIKLDIINFVNKIKNEKIIYENVYSIDESSFCVNDYKTYGYSKKGVEIKTIKKHKKTQERRTVLSCININGEHMYKIIEGSVNGSMFLDFIKANKDILYNKTLLLDNARIHHNKDLKSYCIDNNIKLLYNAPYTPEYNPIEYVFSKMKTYFKNLNHDNLIGAINESVCIINGTDLSPYYKKCKQNVESCI